MLFINGLPIIIIELKNPVDENTGWEEAFNQLQTYKEQISDLFVYNEALVASDGFTARLGSLTANQERFMPWRTIANEKDRPLAEFQIETVVKGFLQPEMLLDYIRYFIIFEEDGDTIIKKIAGYHQFHAVREAVRATIIAANDNVSAVLRLAPDRKELSVLGKKKGGVVWHTQGSGKSISMCCYAGKLLQQPEMNNPTLLVVTDRNDLDGQLFQTFCDAQDLLKQTPVQVDSREALREVLSSRQSGGIIFTTVQKFSLMTEEDNHPVLCERSNVVVISDEAHRSQYGFKAVMDKKTGQYKYGYAKHLRDALPNASFIGFTGTPIELDDKDTRAVFGDYVSVYDIQDAVNDGATVQIYYESRLAKLDIDSADIQRLNDEVEDIVSEDEEDIAIREKTKSTWSQLEKLVGAAPRLHEVAADLVKHFEARTKVIDGKAMIVCMSREICARLYNELIALRPSWHNADPEKGVVKIVMTGSAMDSELIRPHIYSKQVKKRLEKRFKDPADEMKLVIVRDMWLTGFDAPCCHTMYVDKPMRGHNLMQAIARVNRVFKDKSGGLVVDYIGIGNELKEALKAYTNANGKGVPTLTAEEAFRVMREKLDAVRTMLHGFDYSEFERQGLKLLVPAVNHVLGLDDGKNRFLDLMLALTKAYSLCVSLDAVAPLHKEIAFLCAIKSAIMKNTVVDSKRTEESKNSLLKQIIDNAVVAGGIVNVFELAGLDRPNIGLLSDEFLDEVRNMRAKNLAVELLEKLLLDEIKSHSKNNIVQQMKYGDRLMATLRKYHNRSIETAQVIEELIAMAKEYQADLLREQSLGLGHDEIAFYDALANNESAVRQLGDDTLKQIAIEITEKLRKSADIDWQIRDSVRAKLRILVRRTLKRWKYPPDKQEEAIDLVLKQAEALCDDWSA
jgi:type I restriction enzyme R subunit